MNFFKFFKQTITLKSLSRSELRELGEQLETAVTDPNLSKEVVMEKVARLQPDPRPTPDVQGDTVRRGKLLWRKR
jgi:hypothetical protein